VIGIECSRTWILKYTDPKFLLLCVCVCVCVCENWTHVKGRIYVEGVGE
jgi:hypothetical protein